MTPSSPSVSPRSNTRLWDLVKIALAIVFLIFVVSKTDIQQVKALGDKLSPGWLGLSFILFCLLTVLKALQYHYLIGRRMQFPRVLGVVILQNGITNFVTTAAGIASYLTMLGAEKDVRLGRAAVSFLVAKMGDLIAVSLLLLLSTVWAWQAVHPIRALAMGLLALDLAIILVFFAAVLLRGRFVDILRRLVSTLKLERFGLIRKAMEFLQSLAEQDQAKAMRMVAAGTIYSLVYMVVVMLWTYTRLRTFSLSLDMVAITFVGSILQIASWVPVYVFGGLGISETLSVYLYGIFGVDKPEIAAILLAGRLIFYLMSAAMLLYLPLQAVFQKNSSREA